MAAQRTARQKWCASFRIGLHRHLLVPLETSGRRFQQKGIWQLVKFYARITPLLWLGRWEIEKHNLRSRAL
jgi:hypothetical protein